VSTLLSDIQGYAWIVSTRANRLTVMVEDLLNQPDYPTKAGHELEQAETNLRRALTAISHARKMFEGKPVEKVRHLEAAE
jgi:hypothetical protein